jgi:hypothetical protein
MGGFRRPSSRSCAPDIRSCRTPPASRTTRASRNLKSCTAPSTVRSLFLSIARVWSVYLCACACVCYACSYVSLSFLFFFFAYDLPKTCPKLRAPSSISKRRAKPPLRARATTRRSSLPSRSGL